MGKSYLHTHFLHSNLFHWFSTRYKGLQHSGHSHSPALAPEELVFNHSESHHRPSQGASCSSGSGFTASWRSSPSQSIYVTSSHLNVFSSQSEVDTLLSSLSNAFLSPAGSLHSRPILQDGGYSRIGVSKGS